MSGSLSSVTTSCESYASYFSGTQLPYLYMKRWSWRSLQTWKLQEKNFLVPYIDMKPKCTSGWWEPLTESRLWSLSQRAPPNAVVTFLLRYWGCPLLPLLPPPSASLRKCYRAPPPQFLSKKLPNTSTRGERCWELNHLVSRASCGTLGKSLPLAQVTRLFFLPLYNR